MSKINVLLANDHLSIGNTLHGVARLFSLWVPRFDNKRFKITVCILREKDRIGEEFERRFGEIGVKIRFLGRGKFDPFTLMDFIKIIREEEIDVMHLQAYGASNFGRIAGFITRTPTIVHAHDDDINYPWYQKMIDMLLCKFTDKAIAISESVKNSCISKRRIGEAKLTVMYNGIALEKFRIPGSEEIEKEKRRLGIASSYQVVGAIAKLREEKGIEYLLKSVSGVLSAFPDTIFVIVGDGPLRKELEGLSIELKIDQNVLFAGYRDDVPRVLSIFDIKVLPSISEGFGLAIVEAMAMGKPVIATSVGGIKEILRDGETGLLVPPKDPRALAEKIIYLLENKNVAKRLGLKAREESRKYDVNFNVRTLEKLYSELAHRG